MIVSSHISPVGTYCSLPTTGGYVETEDSGEIRAVAPNLTKEIALQTQVGGGHYKDFRIQPVEFIFQNKIPFVEGCVIKYVCRYRNKSGKQDLEKAIHFLQMLIELEYPNG